MRKDNGYGKQRACTECGTNFIKTVQTGNKCWTCRHKRHRTSAIVKRGPREGLLICSDEQDKVEALTFINKVERRAGFITSLIELNELIACWQKTNLVNHHRYDNMNPGAQLNKMWRDLLTWRSTLTD